MRWILAFHIIFMVAWFAGLFYLPRLFVYHTEINDEMSHTRFCLMEQRLFYFIMTPAGILTSLFGLWLLSFDFSYYLAEPWLLTKLILVSLLWAFHIYCGTLILKFKQNTSFYTAVFFRIFNEIPTLLLTGIVILVIVKPKLF